MQVVSELRVSTLFAFPFLPHYRGMKSDRHVAFPIPGNGRRTKQQDPGGGYWLLMCFLCVFSSHLCFSAVSLLFWVN